MDKSQNLAMEVVKHSVKMGIPPEVLPSEQYLEKIGRTKNCSMLDNFLMTDTKQAVRIARMNILVQNSKDDMSSNRKSTTMKNFLRFQKLKEKLADVHTRHGQAKQREIKRLDDIFDTDIRIEKSKIQMESKKVKVEILRAKVEQLNAQINDEISLDRTIKSVSTATVYMNPLTDAEVFGETQRCIKLLQQFYNAQSIDLETTKIRDEMRRTFQSIPNILTFTTIIKGLESANDELKHHINSFSQGEQSTLLRTLFAKFNVRIITGGIACHSRDKKIKETKTLCGASIQSITNQIELNQSFEYSFQYEDDSVGNFVAVLLRQLDLQGKVNKASGLIKEMLLQRSEKNDGMKDLNSRIQDTQKIQKLIAEKISHFQQISAQSLLMNSKLQNCKLTMLHLVQDLKNANKFQLMSRTVNLSTACDNDSVNHVAEVKAFTAANFDKFGVASPTIEFEIKRNRLLKDDDSIALLIKHNFCDISGTIRNLIDNTRRSFEKKRVFDSITGKKNKPKIRKQVVETSDLRKQLDVNRCSLTEKLDQISSVNADSTIVLNDNKRLYNYSVTNPLKAFIPFGKKFDGKCFKAYENDFNLYYRMIKDKD